MLSSMLHVLFDKLLLHTIMYIQLYLCNLSLFRTKIPDSWKIRFVGTIEIPSFGLKTSQPELKACMAVMHFP